MDCQSLPFLGWRMSSTSNRPSSSNTVSVGGLVNLPRDKVALDDGRFEVLLIRQPKNGKDWQSILTALTTLELGEDGAVVGFQTGEVTFTCDAPVAWTVDGEFGGEQAVTHIHSHTRAIAIASGAGPMPS